ncbi:coordinator of PRMT5 and differentiation stimulator isoform X3 [Dromaius novaehollandiae]|uniref:coordinator of PRMT5 and differentiation stimulator isoform X3 n=1 Tax=Dromaius novaehollandiae TaxID=8790 RepID=UPI00311ECB3E
MAAAVGYARLEEEQLPGQGGTATWKPRKECLPKNIPNIADSEAQESEFSDISHYEKDVSGSSVESAHFCSDLEDWDGEASSVPGAAVFPELQTAAEYEVEDWDKELEDSEFNPYAPEPRQPSQTRRAGEPNVALRPRKRMPCAPARVEMDPSRRWWHIHGLMSYALAAQHQPCVAALARAWPA